MKIPHEINEELDGTTDIQAISQRIAALPPEKRALLELRLMEHIGERDLRPQGIPRRDASGPAPLSFAQERLWLVHQLDPASPAYNMASARLLDGDLQVDGLQASLDYLLRRHEPLRTSFAVIDGRPMQVIHPLDRMAIRQIDLRSLDSLAAEEVLNEVIHEEKNRPFDLTRSPLLRATLVQLGVRKYVLILVMHHICSDGWSMALLWRELSILYNSFVARADYDDSYEAHDTGQLNGRTVEGGLDVAEGQGSEWAEGLLAELPIQYADFAQWQRDSMQGNLLSTQLGYWMEQMKDAETVLDLPTDRVRPAVQSFRGRHIHFALSPEQTEALKSLSRGTGTTLFMTLLAAFQVLLYRYTGQHDLIVGTPVADRTRTELEELFGCFLNTIALRSQLRDEQTFLDVQDAVRSTTLAAFAHQDLPFERLLEELQLERSLSHTPLVQVMFNFHNMPRASLYLQDLHIDTLDSVSYTSKLDLTLTMREDADGLKGNWEYSTDLFDEATVVGMATHYENFLTAVCENPKQSIGAIRLLSSGERQRMLVEWNQTADLERFILDEQPSLNEQFQVQVAKTPDAPAFLCNGETLTYRGLNERANRLARVLRQHIAGAEAELGAKVEARSALLSVNGAGDHPQVMNEAGVFVGLAMERSLDAVVALMAIYKIGAIYVPLDPGYPVERIAYMVNDAQMRVVLTTCDVRDSLLAEALAAGSHQPDVICVDEEADGIAAQAGDDLEILVAADQVAYVIYTSGSTGQPKGAVVPHRQILNRLAWMWRAYPFGPDEMGCQKTSLSFVDSLWELFGYVLQGVPTVILPDTVVKDTPAFVDALAQHGVSRIWLVPSLLRVLLNTNSDLQTRLPQLKFWVVSGEPLPGELARRFQEVMPDSTLYNLYGTSEVWDVTWYDPALDGSGEPDERAETGLAELATVPIGKPIANMRTYILDDNLQPVPIGVRGDLYVGGVGLARGYLNRPGLTDEVFLRDPFVSLSVTEVDRTVSNARMYRTGDKARYLADGNIEFLGRDDFQVKIRGYRVELEEIEAALNQQEAIEDCAVVVHERTPGDQRLIGYYVVAPEHIVTADELREFLRGKLPSFMVPGALMEVEALPLTPSGKINRKALPEPDGILDESDDGYVPARDSLELLLVNIWEETLGVRGIGIHHNFFDLGGHSILAVRLFDLIEKQTGKNLPLSSLFQAPMIGEMAEILRTQDWQVPWTCLVPVQPGGDKLPFFIVPPLGTTSLRIVPLITQLGQGQPVFGFDPLGADGRYEPHLSVEEMAEHYIREIKMLRPTGPYILGGMCFGGHVALEMARHLSESGDDVPLLVILDANAPSSGPSWTYPHSLREKAQYYWKRGRQHSGRGNLFFALLNQIKGLKVRIVRYLNRPQRLAAVNGVYMEDIRNRHALAARDFVAQPFPGKMTLFQSEQFYRMGMTMRWEELALGEFEQHILPNTTHKNIVDLAVNGSKSLAYLLRDQLDQVNADPRWGTSRFEFGEAEENGMASSGVDSRDLENGKMKNGGNGVS